MAPRTSLSAAVATAWLAAALCATAVAQDYPPGGAPQYQPPGGVPQNPACVRLESQLSAVDRGATDPARADQLRRFEEAANRQQSELDRMTTQARRQGCEGSGFFSLFGGQPPQCAGLNNQIQQMRSNLSNILANIQQLQNSSMPDREGQRRAIITALAQNNCGPQYRAAAAQPNGFFETLFSRDSMPPGLQPEGPSGYRTVCVRTCDGFYYPISYATSPAQFRADEQTCQRMCPAAEVIMFSHRNPGEDISQAVSISGRRYTELPNAFQYRKAFNPSCSCKKGDQTWADALRHLDDQTLERGDIIVTEDRAKQMSAPRDAQGRPIRQDPRAAGAAPAAAPESEEPPQEPDPKRKVRNVGPTFIPAR